MGNIKVKDLSDTSTLSADNKLMVLTNETNNTVKNITVSNLTQELISADEDNATTVGTDGKIYTPIQLTENANVSLSNLDAAGEAKLGNKRNIGQIILSTIPLSDAGLHLLDGTLISGSGSYSTFVDYIANLYTSGDYTEIFETEADWQATVATYGVCGKFVYDSINDTVRLPKVTGFIEGASGIATLGNVTAAGLPSIAHTHTRGDMNITGTMLFNGTDPERQSASSTGCFSTSYWTSGGNDHDANVGNAGVTYTMNAANSWTGSTSTNSAVSSIYGNSSTVQPQSVQVLYYIVVATSAKTEIEVDIDEIATDLNGKADKDLANLDTYGNNRLHALKGYLDEGELLTDAEGLADLTQMAHSTFDGAKFTIVGSPTITSTGLITETTVWDKQVQIPINKLDVSLPFKLNFRVMKNTFISNNQLIGGGGSSSNVTIYASGSRYGDCRIHVYDSGTSQSTELKIGDSWDTIQQIPNDAIVDVSISWDGTNYYYKVTNSNNGTVYADENVASNLPLDNVNYNNIIGNFVTLTGCYFDLKHTYIVQNNITVFSGNITGSHTYTIGGSTVTIPYTLSKTGSMIVDSAYRTQVAALYAQEGVAPYYTLQKGVNFTLPQGEVYGMIQNAYQNVLPDYASGITMGFPASPTTTASTFTAPSAGWAYIHGERAGGTGGTLHCYVNNVPVGIFVALSPFGSSVIFPVSKGDVISVDVDVNSTWTINEQYFYPSKGV